MRLLTLLIGAAGLAAAQANFGQPSNLPSPTLCDKFAVLQMTTATTTQMVAAPASGQIRVCAYQIQGSTSSTATTLTIVSGTGSNCASSQTSLTPAWSLAASALTIFSHGAGIGEIFQAPSATALCGKNSAAGTVNIFITYTMH